MKGDLLPSDSPIYDEVDRILKSIEHKSPDDTLTITANAFFRVLFDVCIMTKDEITSVDDVRAEVLHNLELFIAQNEDVITKKFLLRRRGH